MAFGRRRRQHHETQKEPNKKLAKKDAHTSEGGEKRCKAGPCAYSAVMEASRFKAEATRNAPTGAGACSASWDCRSALYDSFELDSFSHKLGHTLAQERLRTDVASTRQKKAGRRASLAPAPRWQSRRHAGGYVSCFPSCFPKRTPIIQLGKRKGPSLQAAVHVVAKLARRGCHVIAGIPTSRRPQVQISQAQLHYHHHLHHVTVEELNQELYGNVHGLEEAEKGRVLLQLHTQVPLEEPTCCLSSHSLPYLPLPHIDHHMTSIRYQP